MTLENEVNANQGNANQGNANQANVSQITIKLPVFPKKHIKLWFAQVEAQFTTWKITSEKTKFAYVAGQLDHDIAERVADIILAPPEENPYSTLKSRLISELEESEQRQLRRLLEEITLDDRKPSVLLRELRSYANGKVNDDFLKGLFIQRLPAHVRAILASLNECNLQTLANTADKILESSKSFEVAAVSTSSSESSNEILVTSLAQQVLELSTMMKKLMENLESNHRSRSPYRNFRRDSSRSRSRSRTQSKDFCWYHNKFGDKATKCTTPCAYVKKAEN